MRYTYITEGEKLDKIKNLFKKHGGKMAAGLGAILAAGYAASHPEEVSQLAHAAKEKMADAAEGMKDRVSELRNKISGAPAEGEA
jgi:predicted negative regulator of RcsB-dependent stress response